MIGLSAFARNLKMAKGSRTVHRLNRSQRLPWAKSYEHAREIARAKGKSDRPVR